MLPSNCGTISELEVSLSMDRSIKLGMEMIRKNGFLIPILYTFSRGKPMDLDISHEIVVETKSNMNYSTLYEDQENPVLCSLAAVCVSSREQEAYLIEIAKKMVNHPSVEAFGFMEGSFYRAGLPGQNTGQLQDDPNAQRLIHSVYYMRGDKIPRINNIPFINRGKINNIAPDSDDQYEVHFMESTWIEDTLGSEALVISYPFTEEL